MFNLSMRAITDFTREANQNIIIPAMAKNTQKIIRDQQEQIEEQSHDMWDRMYPRIDNSERYPVGYPEEWKEKKKRGLDVEEDLDE